MHHHPGVAWIQWWVSQYPHLPRGKPTPQTPALHPHFRASSGQKAEKKLPLHLLPQLLLEAKMLISQPYGSSSREGFHSQVEGGNGGTGQLAPPCPALLHAEAQVRIMSK